MSLYGFTNRAASKKRPLILFSDACEKYNLTQKELSGMLRASDAPKAVFHAGGYCTTTRTYFDGRELHSFLKQKGKV